MLGIYLKKHFLLLLLMVIVIFSLIAAILLIDHFQKNNTSSKESPLKNYQPLKDKITGLASDERLSNNSEYTRLVQKMINEEDPKITMKDRYTNLVMANNFLQSLYSELNDPKYGKLIKEFDNVAKENFPGLYKSSDFSYPCQDPTCSNSTIPEEIKSIISSINTTDFPEDIKQLWIKDITNGVYLQDNDPSLKVSYYYSIATNIRDNNLLSKNNSGTKIYEEFTNYLKIKYTKAFTEILKNFENSEPIPSPKKLQ